MEETNIQIGGGRRLVLGFDAGCTTCSELAKKIEEAVDGKLEVRSLSDPMMEHWRREVFGAGAPWAPTLVEVNSGSVKAWTGVRMGARLSRDLGPVTTWRVMQVLGEMRNKPAGAGQEAGADAFSRGRFLKGASGTVLAFGLFSGFALPAFANTKQEAQEAVERGRQADRAIALMERHMEIKSSVALFLDEKSLEDDIQAGLGKGIDHSVFVSLKQNLADTNAKLLKGKALGQSSRTEAADLFPTVFPQAAGNSQDLSKSGCAGRNGVQYFWWGRRSWIDNCYTNKLVQRLIGGAGIFAIIACFPVGGAPAGMASALMGLGGYAIDNANRGRGVYVNYILRLVAVRVRPQ